MAATIADLIEDRFGLPVEAGRNQPAQGELAAILTRRVHRRFRPDPVPDEVLQTVARSGFTSPTPIQMQSIPVLLTGRDVVGIAQRECVEVERFGAA